MTRTRWIIFVVICVVTLGALVALSKRDNVNVDSIDASKVISGTDTAIGDQVYGNKDSKIVLFEYGDFQCPGCGGAYAGVKSIKEDYKNQIAFVFRNFPLTNIHPNALAAATAAEAAGLQGKYWEMHDMLFENQNVWSGIELSKRTDTFIGYAGSLGIDTDTFKTDLSDPRVSTKINRDRSLGNKLGVSSTPTFYLGDERLSDKEVTDVIQNNGALLRAKIDVKLKELGIESPAKADTTKQTEASE